MVKSGCRPVVGELEPKILPSDMGAHQQTKASIDHSVHDERILSGEIPTVCKGCNHQLLAGEQVAIKQAKRVGVERPELAQDGGLCHRRHAQQLAVRLPTEVRSGE